VCLEEREHIRIELLVEDDAVEARRIFATWIVLQEGWTQPGEAIRGPSRSSTAPDPEPTAQTDPKQTLRIGRRDFA
jgi:hypothetical protein